MKNIIQGFGIPAIRHKETDGGLIPQILATSVVPPKASMIWLGVRSIDHILGAPKQKVKGLPNVKSVRIAYMQTLKERAAILLDLAVGSVTSGRFFVA